jgi:hypothetical protein
VKKTSRIGALGLALAAAGTLSLALLVACTDNPPPGAVYASVAPPAAEVEVAGVAPGPDMIWIHGYHTWDGSAYHWTKGRWEARPRAGARWVDGRWVHHRRGWYWREGEWR